MIRRKKESGTTEVVERPKATEELTNYYVLMKVKKFIATVFFMVLVVGLCFAILYPMLKILPVVFNDFSDLGNPDVIWIPIDFSVQSFDAAIRFAFGNGSDMVKSILYALSITFIQVIISAMAGYSLGRVQFPFKRLIMMLVILTIVVPPQSLLISQYLFFKDFDFLGIFTLTTGGTIDLINKPFTLYLLALTGFGVKQSIFVFIFTQFFKGLPIEIEEAAYIDGCGFYRNYWKIAFPNAIPAITTVSVLAFVWNYADTYYTGYFHPTGPYMANTLATTFASNNMLNILRGVEMWYDMPGANNFVFDAIKYASAILYLIPLLIFYFFVQKKLVESFERSGITG